MFLEPETIHLHPLNFLINSLDSLPSTQLSLIQFHDQKNEFLSEESMKLWKLRRILSIQFPNLTKLCPKNDQQHDSNFNFNLNNLNELTSQELILVRVHPLASKKNINEAVLIFSRRRNLDLEQGLEWNQQPLSRNDVQVNIESSAGKELNETIISRVEKFEEKSNFDCGYDFITAAHSLKEELKSKPLINDGNVGQDQSNLESFRESFDSYEDLKYQKLSTSSPELSKLNVQKSFSPPIDNLPSPPKAQKDLKTSTSIRNDYQVRDYVETPVSSTSRLLHSSPTRISSSPQKRRTSKLERFCLFLQRRG